MSIQTMASGYAPMGKCRGVKNTLKAHWRGNANADTMLSIVGGLSTEQNHQRKYDATTDWIGAAM